MCGPLVFQVWRTFVEHLDLAIAERKLHKHHRLLTAAGTILDDILQQSVRKADIGSTLPLHLWVEQKEVYLEASRRTAISLCESTILVCVCTLQVLNPHVWGPRGSCFCILPFLAPGHCSHVHSMLCTVCPSLIDMHRCMLRSAAIKDES